uniref:Ion_trans domain-containing protein n=1 Tax=Angiostrongylus cantonensis TaxID=6313 RepID=A0A0K0D486_ANGCA
MRLNLNAKAEGFYGMFNDFGASVFTVYLAASEEGWVYVLYDCMDSLPSHLAFVYFLTLIFFLAWLVKNVFIAVITETFAEIRVQFSEMWQKKDVTLDEEFGQRLEKYDDGWRLIRLDADVNYEGPKHALQTVGFTLLFNLECLIKISCYGLRNFLRRGIFKFEMILCIGSSINAIKYFYDRNYFTYFQAFRLLRLIKASPILEDFVWKIFSPGKKLGGLVIFTITFVIIASAISLQLFYAVPNLYHFHTFPQEGWTDFVVEVLRATDDKLVPFVAIYFVAYHLFVTLIVLSLFVAVILDNLEMDEELKKVKQLRAREAVRDFYEFLFLLEQRKS